MVAPHSMMVTSIPAALVSAKAATGLPSGSQPKGRIEAAEHPSMAHSHPNGEQVIYIIRGSGRVLVGTDVSPVREGTAVLFPRGVVHMLHNTGPDEMKVVCFFAPPTGLDNHVLHEGVDFPDGQPAA